MTRPNVKRFAKSHTQPAVVAALAASDDPTEYRQVRGAAARRVLAIRFECGGCGTDVGAVQRFNDEEMAANAGLWAAGVPVNAPVLKLGKRVEAWEVLNDDGSFWYLDVPCPHGCLSGRGNPRALRLTEGKANGLLDALAARVGPNVRSIETLTF